MNLMTLIDLMIMIHFMTGDIDEFCKFDAFYENDKFLLTCFKYQYLVT